MELTISVLSRTGGRPTNQDAYGVWPNRNNCFLALSDGAGGHSGGDYASKLAVKEVLEYFQHNPVCDADSIAGALRAANAAIVEAQRQTSQLAEMHATVVVLAIDSEIGSAIWGHVGDTRLYWFRNQRILMQTRDHSVLQTMVDAGYLPSGEVRGSPQRNLLLAALGGADGFEPCIEANLFPLQDGDVFLLCTDGFWEYVDETRMEQALQSSASQEEWLRQLERLVIAHGGEDQDNYSALAVSCKAHAPAI